MLEVSYAQKSTQIEGKRVVYKESSDVRSPQHHKVANVKLDSLPCLIQSGHLDLGEAQFWTGR